MKGRYSSMKPLYERSKALRTTFPLRPILQPRTPEGLYPKWVKPLSLAAAAGYATRVHHAQARLDRPYASL